MKAKANKDLKTLIRQIKNCKAMRKAGIYADYFEVAS
jgi:hypothetical protein